jgi:hypothetical protein
VLPGCHGGRTYKPLHILQEDVFGWLLHLTNQLDYVLETGSPFVVEIFLEGALRRGKWLRTHSFVQWQ